MFASTAPPPTVRRAVPFARRAVRPSRIQILRRRLGALLLVALAAVTVGYLWPGDSTGAAPARAHVVRPGETLWAIAAAAYGGDPRPHVAAIERRNHLGSAGLRPGQVLVLP